jgi:hypothetical protein
MDTWLLPSIGGLIGSLITLLFVFVVFRQQKPIINDAARLRSVASKSNDSSEDHFDDNSSNDNNNNTNNNTKKQLQSTSDDQDAVVDDDGFSSFATPVRVNTQSFDTRKFAVLCEPTASPLNESQRILEHSHDEDNDNDDNYSIRSGSSQSDDYAQRDAAAWLAQRARPVIATNSLTASQKLTAYGYYESVDFPAAKKNNVVNDNDDDNDDNNHLVVPRMSDDDDDDVASVASGCGRKTLYLCFIFILKFQIFNSNSYQSMYYCLIEAIFNKILLVTRRRIRIY